MRKDGNRSEVSPDGAATDSDPEANRPKPRQPGIIAVTRRKDEQMFPAIPKVLAILPLPSLVLFPGTLSPLSLKRASSRQLLEESLPQSLFIGIATQRNPEQEEPAPEDLYPVGVAALVLKLMRPAEDQVLIAVQAVHRIALGKILASRPFIRAEVQVLHSTPPPAGDKQWEATLGNLRETARKLIELSPGLPNGAQEVLNSIADPGLLADFLAGILNFDVAQKQDLLEELNTVKRVRALQLRLSAQLEIAQLQQKIEREVASQFTDAHRRFYLEEQVRAIKKELGEEDTGIEEQVSQLRKRLQAAQLPKELFETAERELNRLKLISPASPEYSVVVGYVEILAELPWAKLSPDRLDLDQAEKILNRDHYDLEKVKRRLLEYLAVRKLNPEGHGPILCFLGPPGVGKTSLGQSIAEALGRKFSRMSLGGISDEAEIRGHRRTYVGAMPGRIIQELRRLGTRNPVMMLDEVDKIGKDFRGDPASALLEVLDPRQNNSFVDRYLDAPFDLSQVLFIATANYLEPVPPALRDRMEVVELPGYTAHEKLEIAKRYLVRRQLQENGLTPEQCPFEEVTLQCIIDDYTHEAGVRELERQIAAVCRSVAAQVARGRWQIAPITPALVQEFLGPALYVREMRLTSSRPGVVTGLAYTPAGGEVLFIEATRYPGTGRLILTGQIGEVMKESVQAALSLVRSRVKELGIDPVAFKDTDIHVHVPSGAVPKDGPSAGVAMFTALASLFSNTPVRADLAMTGEITLRGLVLPIGGLKEKSLAALRAGLHRVLIPKLNEKDLRDLPSEVKQAVKFLPAETVDEVLAAALEKGSGTPSFQTPGSQEQERLGQAA